MPGIDDDSVEVSRGSKTARRAKRLGALASREKQGCHCAQDDAEERMGACVFADFFHENLPCLLKHSEESEE
jgi:hypothetical protein